MLFHEEKMRAENTELTLNYKKYKQELQEVKLNKEFFLVTNNNRYVNSSCGNKDLLLYIFIKTYRLELKVINQLVSTKTTRQLVLVFKESKSTQLIENLANFAVPVIISVRNVKIKLQETCMNMYAVHIYAVVLQEFCSGPSIPR